LALTPGTRLGVYEVIASIGVGGMGEVYRATDTTLSRQVAIKILPDAFASDPERFGTFRMRVEDALIQRETLCVFQNGILLARLLSWPS
jgi:serine/threonine protein kinase